MSKTPHLDRKGYYRALRVRPDASDQEIQLAFALLKQAEPRDRGMSLSELTRIYETLKSPARRQAYDHDETASRPPLGIKLKLDDVRLLVACTVLLVAILGFVWYPLYGSRFRRFEAGDQLVNLQGAAFGVVVQTDEAHTFPSGAHSEAYLVEVAGTGELRWFPALDLQAACRRRAH